MGPNEDTLGGTMKASLAHQVLEVDNGLRTRAQRYWIAIGLKDKEFNRRQQIAQAILDLTKEQMIFFIEANLLPESGRLVMATSQDTDELEKLIVDEHLFVDSTDSFQNGRSYLTL